MVQILCLFRVTRSLQEWAQMPHLTLNNKAETVFKVRKNISYDTRRTRSRCKVYHVKRLLLINVKGSKSRN